MDLLLLPCAGNQGATLEEIEQSLGGKIAVRGRNAIQGA